MKKRGFASLVLFSLACFCGGSLSAWERSAMKDCQKQAKNCKGSKDQCNKDADDCKNKAVEKDNASFENSLSPYAKSIFIKFTPERKKQTLDYADKNKMKPDDAVAKTAGNCYCPK